MLNNFLRYAQSSIPFTPIALSQSSSPTKDAPSTPATKFLIKVQKDIISIKNDISVNSVTLRYFYIIHYTTVAYNYNIYPCTLAGTCTFIFYAPNSKNLKIRTTAIDYYNSGCLRKSKISYHHTCKCEYVIH